jgi:hypothetical protein
MEALMTILHPNTALKKTEKGVFAIRDRDRSLGPRGRTLLILVDGVKTATQLSAVGQDAAQGMELIQQLLNDGWIEVVGSAAPSAAASSAVSAPAATAVAVPKRNLNDSIRAACRHLESFMGLGADPLSMQLEKCKSNAEFEAKVQEISQLLVRAHSEKRASDFVAAATGG